MNRFNSSRLLGVRQGVQQTALLLFLVSAFLLTATPASAHHATGGATPANFFEGFLSGLAHPIIGLDHFAVVVSVGLLAAINQQGILIPIAFVLTAMLGTGAHLAGLTIPGVELFVTGSILLFGLLLVVQNRPRPPILIGLSAIAGLFHGYAYGEAIFGAKMMPLFAYLAGFTVIQLVVSLGTFGIAKVLLQKTAEPHSTQLRSTGFVICGVGLAFFASQLVATLFPLPNG